MSDYLTMWTIYDHPTDFPDHFVARRHVVNEVIGVTLEIIGADTLEALRQKLPPGLVCIKRHPSDDPVIVETWL